MWIYHQPTGELTKPDGTTFGFGFSGYGGCINVPSLQNQPNRGPIPIGIYRMCEWRERDDKLGIGVIVLFDNPKNVMFGRSGFRIHGSRDLFSRGLSSFLNSSEGCICIGDVNHRKAIWDSNDHDLVVIA